MYRKKLKSNYTIYILIEDSNMLLKLWKIRSGLQGTNFKHSTRVFFLKKKRQRNDKRENGISKERKMKV